jgi:hypothetical protein
VKVAEDSERSLHVDWFVLAFGHSRGGAERVAAI